MKLLNKTLFTLFLIGSCLAFHSLLAQEDSIEIITPENEIEKTPFIEINGYLKELGSLAFSDFFQNAQYDNLIHQRFNIRLNLHPNLSLKTGIRTRIFNGASVSNNPNLVAFLETDNAQVDLSWVWLRSSHTLIHSNIDRLYLTYQRPKWEVNIGRQRINWGKTNVWNPHDWFNTYAYLDFDYEERPGTDAVHGQYYLGYAGGIELAYAPADNWNESIAAFLLRWNKWNYDFQVIAGKYRDEIGLGGAWAGNIKGLGFKGEFSYFRKRKDFWKASAFLNATLALDYAFPNTLYLQGEFLYNGNWRGVISPELLRTPLPANNLFFGKTALLIGASMRLHPLIQCQISSIYSPDEQLFILVPGCTISLSDNVDFLLTAQILRNSDLEQFNPLNNLLFFRFKWSF